jgi:hypothetical protein
LDDQLYELELVLSFCISIITDAVMYSLMMSHVKIGWVFSVLNPLSSRIGVTDE